MIVMGDFGPSLRTMGCPMHIKARDEEKDKNEKKSEGVPKYKTDE